MVASSPTNFLSLMLLSTAVHLRMELPHIQVLSKIDLTKNVGEVVKWSADPAAFEESLSKTKSGESYTFYSQLFRGIRKAAVSPELYPISGYTRQGFIAVMGELSRIAKAGEEVED